MIKYIECTKLNDKQIYDAFMRCFNDYMIKIKMEQAVFISRFFGCEGNAREYSYAAYKGEKPVGICLGGIKTDEEMKTLRCGGMAVTDDVRGMGVAGKLIDMHMDKAKELECKQLFLEVIGGNDRAIAFYKKHGYEKVYNLTYRILCEESIVNFECKSDVQNMVKSISFDEAKKLRQEDLSHLAWQCSFDYFNKLDVNCYGINRGGKTVAAIAANKSKVFYLWINPKHRNQGFAKALIYRVILDFKPKSLLFTYANNHSAHIFANYLGMEYAKIRQLEMYRLV